MEGAALLEGAVVIEYKYRTAAAVLEGAALLEGAVVIELLRYSDFHLGFHFYHVS